MGGRGGARRASTPEGLESPVQAALAGEKPGELRGVIRGDCTEVWKGWGSTVTSEEADSKHC